MLEDTIIKNLAQKMKISSDRLVVEAWEIIFLKELFQSSFAEHLIFKGGTALRLAYSSPRFSEDLDFSLRKKVSEKEFKNCFNEILKKYPKISIADIKEKHYTLFALIKIKEPFMKLAFSIKVEVSKRITPKNYQSIPKILSSPVIPLEVMAETLTLEQIKSDKIQTVRTRSKARDLFDLWYVCEKLKKPMPKIKNKINPQQIKQELCKFLPKDYYQIISFLIKNYGKAD